MVSFGKMVEEDEHMEGVKRRLKLRDRHGGDSTGAIEEKCQDTFKILKCGGRAERQREMQIETNGKKRE